MKILGIDPGTATTGWGIIDYESSKQAKKLIEFGCILTESTDEMGYRLVVLRKNLQKIIKEHQPDCMIIEKLFFGANSTSALSVGQARGVIMLAASENKLPIFEYTGLQVKLTVADYGRADKGAIQKAVRKHLSVKNLPKPKDQTGKAVFRFRDDAYDAVAAALCHIFKTDLSFKMEDGRKKSLKS